MFTYLANSMRVGDRSVPYSLVAATHLEHIAPGTPHVARAVTARHRPQRLDGAGVNAKPGDSLEIEYYIWDANAGLTTHTATFTVAASFRSGPGGGSTDGA